MDLMQEKLNHFFKDNTGRVVLWQSPNVLLSTWIILKLVAVLLRNNHLKSGFEQLSTAVLFAWACYEAAKGVNYFRKTLGFVVLAIIICGFFI